MQVGVLGVNHKSANVDLREKLSVVCDKRFSSDSSIHGRHALVSINTCNRMEVYFSSSNLAATHSYLLHVFRREVGSEDFDHLLYSYFGEDCFTHLSRVTAGLDSAVIGETEIQGQVKKAYEIAAQFQRLPQALHFMFQKALKIGKTIRSEAYELSVIPSVEKVLFDVSKTLLKKPKVLFVGASQINMKVLKYFLTKDIEQVALTNRTWENGLEACKGMDVELIPWEKMSLVCGDYDVVVFGTKYCDYLLSVKHKDALRRERYTLVDLSVPRNVDPALAFCDHIDLWNIDRINQKIETMRKSRLSKTSWAEQKVELSVERLVKSFMKKEVQQLEMAHA